MKTRPPPPDLWTVRTGPRDGKVVVIEGPLRLEIDNDDVNTDDVKSGVRQLLALLNDHWRAQSKCLICFVGHHEARDCSGPICANCGDRSHRADACPRPRDP